MSPGPRRRRFIISTPKPNIVLLHTDQQRSDALSLAGHPVLKTPNLDRLVSRGAWFTNTYSECPICIPARHALMTGMSPHASGVVGFSQRARIAREDATLPELLKRGGYQTVMIGRGMHTYPAGKHYGFEICDGQPMADPYSVFHQLDLPDGGGMNWPHNTGHGLGANDVGAEPWPHDERFHQTNYSVNKALRFLRDRDPERPYFLAVGTVAPHPPLVPPKRYLDRMLEADLTGPAIADWATPPEGEVPAGYGKQDLTGELGRRTIAGYLALIEHLDDQLGRLFETLEASDEPTYILFSSDHGEMLGDHYFWRKALPYEGSAHVPMSLTGPGIEPGTRRDHVAGWQDILPTCCDLAGVEIPEHVTGQSLMDPIRDEQCAWRDWLHGEHSPMSDQHPGMHYATDGRTKYIWFNDGNEQLFDLKADPREMHNLVAEPESESVLNTWRARLIGRLVGRPEGFSDGERLIPERPWDSANALATVDA